MKNKNILIAIILFLIGGGVVVYGVFLGFGVKTEKKEETKKNKIYKYENLFELADQLYLDNSYLELPKTENGEYYMTIKEYKKRGFNSVLLDPSCPDDTNVFIFDPEHKDLYVENPLFVIKRCKEDPDTIALLDLAKQLYSDGKYMDLPQNSEMQYYMTISEYKKRGYNIEFIDDSCPEDTKIIYFDEANKEMYPGRPVFVSGCNY